MLSNFAIGCGVLNFIKHTRKEICFHFLNGPLQFTKRNYQQYSTWQAMYVSPPPHFQTAMVNVLDLLVLAHIPQVTDVVNVSMVVNACRCIGLVQIFKYTR